MADLSCIDSIEDLTMTEDRGAIRSLVRKAKVHLSTADLDPVVLPNDRNESLGLARRSHNALQVVLNFMSDEGFVPNKRLLIAEDKENPFNFLVLTKRSVKALDDPQNFEVILNYEHIIEGPNQTLLPILSQNVYARGRCSIVEKTTNFYYPEGKTELDRVMILTAHTFPTDTRGAASRAKDPAKPRTVIAGGEISLPYPQTNMRVEGLYTTNNTNKTPYAVAKSIVRHVNETAWNDDPPLTWLCTEATWELNAYADPADIVGLPAPPVGFQIFGKLPQYKMTFEFQYNSDGWDPFVVFIDPETGRPPAEILQSGPDLDGGVPTTYTNGAVSVTVFDSVLHPNTAQKIPAGAWNVPALPRLNFNVFFRCANFDGVPSSPECGP